MSDVAAILRSTRLARGMSQDDLAKAVGITKSYLSHIEHGRRQPPAILLHRLNEQLEAKPDSGRTYEIATDADGQVRRVDVHAGSLHDALVAAAALPESAWSGDES